MTDDKKSGGDAVLGKIAALLDAWRAEEYGDPRGPMTDDELDALKGSDGYLAFKRFEDGTIAGVLRFLFTYAIVSEVTRFGYSRRWCFSDRMKALCALDDWTDVKHSPQGWHKEVHTGARRDERGNDLGVW